MLQPRVLPRVERLKVLFKHLDLLALQGVEFFYVNLGESAFREIKKHRGLAANRDFRLSGGSLIE